MDARTEIRMRKSEGRVIRLWKSVDCGTQSASGEFASDELPAGFYLVMGHVAKKKRRRKSFGVRAVTMYGPFRAVHAARFMEASAYALGLLATAPAPSSQSECSDHATVAPDDAARSRAHKASVVRLTEMR